jgi:hypothetical protein
LLVFAFVLRRYAALEPIDRGIGFEDRPFYFSLKTRAVNEGALLEPRDLLLASISLLLIAVAFVS